MPHVDRDDIYARRFLFASFYWPVTEKYASPFCRSWYLFSIFHIFKMAMKRYFFLHLIFDISSEADFFRPKYAVCQSGIDADYFMRASWLLCFWCQDFAAPLATNNNVISHNIHDWCRYASLARTWPGTVCNFHFSFWMFRWMVEGQCSPRYFRWSSGI